MKINKRGAVMQAILIPLVIAIIIGAILLIWITHLPLKETIEKEACHDSVIKRSALPAQSKATVPLRCKTQEIKIKTLNEEEIKREIAEEMYDCWWMLGEGKKDFFTESLFRKGKKNCVICSIIEFDDKIKENIPYISDFTSYLSETTVPSKDFTYMEYLTNSKNSKFTTFTNVEDKISTKRNYAIIYFNIKSISAFENLLAIGKFPIAGMGGAGILVKVAGTAISWWIPVTIAAGGIGIGVYEYVKQKEKIKKICETTKGCSGIFLIPLSAESVTNMCETLQNIP